MNFRWIGILLSVLLLAACSAKDEKKISPLFEEMDSEVTKINFQNSVQQDHENNVLVYPYYFNGAGVAIGDINNDGLDDIYFSGNTVSNKLYLNKGRFVFEDITEKAGVSVLEGWKTGVTMADVNKDGWLDIYVCRSAMSDSLLRRNLLFINNHDLTFTESAEKFGIADKGYTTHAAFFDYDKDDDLDLFIINHSLPQFAGFNRLLVNNKEKRDNRFGCRLYKNDDGKFKEVSSEAGIFSNVLSFCLGLTIGDFNNDNWPDIYVSNDFNEEDYLFINNQNGKFRNDIKESTGHVSLFSMGADAADVNNDLAIDILTLDMLPATNERIKLSSGDDNYDKYQFLLDAGFHAQSMRNMLQLNNGHGKFSEIGQLSGISNTDWSWSALMADFDLDGWKDIYVSNGYEKDYTNMQFLKFTVDEQLKARSNGTAPDVNRILDSMPSINVGGFFFKNNRDLSFSKTSEAWGMTRKFKANGAAYSDLDNDGDLDIVINTLNEKAVVFKNKSSETSHPPFIRFDLRAKNPLKQIIGTKILLYSGGTRQLQEFEPARGFQSSMFSPLIFGMASMKGDSARIIWPDDRSQLFLNLTADTTISPSYVEAIAVHTSSKKTQAFFQKENIALWKHHPLDTNDFKRQILLPSMYSFSGPKIAKGDVNGDKLEDFYVCGPKHQAGVLFLQDMHGTFLKSVNTSFNKDIDSQDEDALFFDADNDADLDLYVVSGGYPFSPTDHLLQDRLYLNDGKGNFTKSNSSIPAERNAGSCVKAIDVDHDGDLDLFVGSRFIPGAYPNAPTSMLLVNDGKGKFENRITLIQPNLEKIGMVTDAAVVDLNKDGWSDLVVTGEWMSISFFENEKGKLVDQTTKYVKEDTRGWWNCLDVADFDNDGDDDLIAGNYGLNTQFKVSTEHPATLVFSDFDGDGQVDPIMNYYLEGELVPYASRDEIVSQLNYLKKKFPDYRLYSRATMNTIFSDDQLKSATTLKASMMLTSYLENIGSTFKMKKLPVEVQFSPVHAIANSDVDNDGDLDVILGGNELYTRARIGQVDANRGLLLLNDGKGNFACAPSTAREFDLNGEVRSITPIGKYLLFGINGRDIEVFKSTMR